tara:strand:- start:149 stop:523 length:375 start_codon:yes stop_codon:yes gene_type:complete
MRQAKLFLLFIFSLSALYPHNGRYKSWKKKNNHRIKRLHKKDRFNVSLCYSQNRPRSRWIDRNCLYHHDTDVIFIKNKSKKYQDEKLSIEEIIAYIEKLAVLKEKGVISSKEYDKKKKELLKRI